MAEKPDDVKAKFKQALERKQARRSQRDREADTAEGGRIHATHEAAATQRTFRRKSG